MRVAIIGSRGYPYVYSGYETFVSNIAPRLASLGHEVTVYCHRKLFDARPPAVNGVKLVYVPGLGHKVLSQLSHSLLSTLHVMFSPVDVVIYVNPANGPMGLLLKPTSKRTAINVDGVEWLRPKWKGLGSRYFRFASWLSTKVFDVVITDADAMADIYIREFGCESVTIEYGAEVRKVASHAGLHRLGLSPHEYYLVVGRFIPDNNVGLIVEGFSRAKTNRRLVVVGDVPYEDNYVSKVRKAAGQRVTFTGYVYDQELLAELYGNCYAYIHGHEFGGTNPALLKALGFGAAVLALDTPFSREVLAEGQYGLFFRKDPQDLAQSVEKCDASEEVLVELRSRGPERIAERYTWERIVEEYDELISGMARSSGRDRR